MLHGTPWTLHGTLWMLPGILSQEKHAGRVPTPSPAFFLAVTGKCGQQMLLGQQSLVPDRDHLAWPSLTVLLRSGANSPWSLVGVT